ncbi:MAG TPA: hypothetical protein VKD88_08090 [Gaiellaceae bacterium]|nr:hypothetical protein [Gaiellaceae bacterium]HMG26820.1 hypothetical protein [Acidimicrobiia bacterium]
MAVQDEHDRVQLEIVRLLTSSDPDEIEALADDLGGSGDTRAIGPLVSLLTDSRVNDDPDLEDAVCSSLVHLGAMEQRGNLNYSFVDLSRLTPESGDALRRLDPVIPRRYFRGV